jgi:hypothetical protein
VRHHAWRKISIVCFNTLGRSPPHLFLYLVLLFKEKMETKRKALLAEELGSLYSYSNIFGFCFFKRARCKNQHHLQTKIRFSMIGTYSGILTYLPNTWSLHC